MAEEVKLPALGENVAAGEVVDIKVKPGDEVQAGQALIEVEAEKSTVEVPSPSSGRVAQVLIKRGDKVKTGQALVTIEARGNGKAAPGAPAPANQPAPSPPAATTPPPAVPAEKPAPPARPAAAAPPPSPQGPAPSSPVNPSPVAAAAKPETAPANVQTPSAPATIARDQDGTVPAGPATRKLAREWGVDLAQVAGSGPKGRVTQEDVKGFVKALAAGGGMRAAPPVPDFAQWGPVEPRPFDSIRRKTAEQVTLAWTTIPHVTQHDSADVTEIEAFRKQQEGKGPKLTVTAFALKACAILLRQLPQFNSSLDLAKAQLVLKNYCHIGVAVDTERGLLVPVLRDADKKSVQQIAKEMAELAERARQKKLAADDMRGGCFTISNLGGIGGTGFTPIINYPEVAILGLSRARLEPVFRDGQFVPRLRLPLSLSYDHRVIDGADAARFTRRLAEMLENPLVMLLYA